MPKVSLCFLFKKICMCLYYSNIKNNVVPHYGWKVLTSSFPSVEGTHCMDNVEKTWHAVGSKWRNSLCMDCSCNGCCPAYSTPFRIPNDCVTVFDPEKCDYIVHKKDNPSVLCPIYSAGRAC
uniref:Beta-microseminoprotein n=1 Tax=Lates calcarifer TaxID=8187 RepID=A0A4W6G782_LATCA